MSQTTEAGPDMQHDEARDRVDGGWLAAYVRDGSEGAFRQIVEHYGPMVYSAAYRRLRDHHLAEDACQATFVVLARRAARIRRAEMLSSWLWRVAGNVAANIERRRRRQARREQDAVREHGADRSASWEELAPELDRAMASLPGRMRDALVAHYLAGKTQKQVAAETRVHVNTIQNRIRDGLQRLRGALAARGVAVPSALLASWLTARTTEAAASIELCDAVHAAAWRGGMHAAGAASAEVSRLAREVIHMMQWKSGLKAAAIAAMLGAGAAGVGALAVRNGQDELRLPDEPRYAAFEHPQGILDGPDEFILDFWPESWKKLDLSGTWKAMYYPIEKGADFEQDPGTRAGYSAGDLATTGWEDVAIPGAFPQGKRAGPSSGKHWLDKFIGVAWYRRAFNLPAGWNALQKDGWRVLIRFESVKKYADAWLNGQSLGTRMHGDAPFTFDITGLLAPDDNALAVRVGLPNRDWRRKDRDALWAPVRLIGVPPLYAETLLVATDVAPPALRLRLHLVSYEPEQTRPFSLSLTPAGRAGGGVPLSLPLGPHRVPAGRSVLDLQVAAPGARLWTPEDPNLYLLRVSAGDRDVAGDRIGFRTFEVKGPDFQLNGNRIKLMGTSADGLKGRPDKPARGTRELLACLRQANVNFVRPHNGWFGLLPTTTYHLCDEMGMMVYDEYHYTGKELTDPAKMARRKAEYTAWVQHVHNRAACVLWDFGGNELYNHDIELVPVLDESYNLLGEIDLQRRPRSSSSGRPSMWCFGEMPVMEKMDFADTHAYPGNDEGSYRDLVPETLEFEAAAHQKLGVMPVMNCEYGFGADFVRYRAVTKQIADLYAIAPWGPAEKRKYIEFAESEVPEIGGYLRGWGAAWADFKTYVSAPADMLELGAQRSKRFLDLFRCLGTHLDGAHMNYGANEIVFHKRHNVLSAAAQYLGVPNPVDDSQRENAKPPVFYVYKRAYGPQYVGLGLYARYAAAGETWQAECHILNDSPAAWRSVRAVCQLRDARGTLCHAQQVWQGELPAQLHQKIPIRIALPPGMPTSKCRVELYLLDAAGKRLADNYHDLFVAGREFFLGRIRPGGAVALREPARPHDGNGQAPANTAEILRKLGVPFTPIPDFGKLGQFRFLVFGRNALDEQAAESSAEISRWVEAGGRLLCFEQKAGKIPFLPGLAVHDTRGMSFAQVPIAEHPVFTGLEPGQFDDWNGDQGLLFRQGLYPLDEGLLAMGKVMAEWRKGGNKAWRMAAAAYAVGNGEIVLSQFNVTDRYGKDPIATRFTQNLLAYVLTQPRSPLSLPRGGN
ncbi:MAG: sigma-70 family RNA polymerase sigma factor [Kiritimatiellae bacterium]|nr:sigma-70 family RNA polymerase sigma factor [Kiritimatiellia bacterium]